MKLHLRIRPSTLDGVIGQPKTVSALRGLHARAGFRGEALGFVGPSGTGKTTLAYIVAKMAGFSVVEVDGEGCTVERVREMILSARTSGLFGGTCYVVNEAHSMTQKAVQAMLTFLEKIPEYACIVFTSTEDKSDMFGEFSDPFWSRVKTFKLTNQGLSEVFAEYLHGVAGAEGLNGQPLEAYRLFVQKRKNNLRLCLEDIETGKMRGD